METNKEDNQNETSSERKVPARLPHAFTKDNQPSPEAKSAGWWKKKKGRQLLRHLLELDFDGKMDDPMNPNQKIDNPIKRQIAQYMNVPIEAVTVEMVLMSKQIALGVQKNDTAAFNTLMDNAYGKPKETFQLFDDKKPEIVFNLAFPKEADNEESAFPPIEESEEFNEKETDKTETNE